VGKGGVGVSARWTDGEDDARIDVVLRRRALRAVFEPVVRLDTGLVSAYAASIRGPLGSPLEHEDRLFTAAAHRGAVRQLDEVRLDATLDAVQRAKLTRPLTLFAKRDPAAVVAAASPSLAEVARHLPVVIELASVAPVSPGALAEAAARAREHGCRVAVSNLGTDARARALLATLAPDFVKVDVRFVERNDDALPALAACAADAGATFVAAAVDTERDAALVQAAGIEFAHGLRYGRPDLLVRAPAIHDPEGIDASRFASVRRSGD
jgi:EAL domain-containing protein (putative c-di-GMP-specific phosphodiesterase class I)